MATQQINPHSFEEKLIWLALILTYPFFALGALYVTGSLIGWLIFIIAILRWYINGKEPLATIPAIIWLWIIAGLVMLLALIIAHANWELGLMKTIKSSIGWTKGWALMPLFLLLGSIVQISPKLLIRAICVVSFHSLLFAVITVAAYILSLPGDLFISPLEIIGGPGADFFKVSLYGLNPETGAGRWRFFTPWAPAAGFMACIFLIFCLQERNSFWRYAGLAGSLAMCLLSQSRAGWVIYSLLIPLSLYTGKLDNPILWVVLGLFIPAVLLLGEPIYHWIISAYEDIKASRPDSTRVRSTLESIAIQRWSAEAPIWGHGIVERGPKIVEGMPIGSHHSWYGLLFVKGIVGLLALAIPLFFTSIYLLIQSKNSQMARAALCMVLVFICYSFFENLEILTYLFWPALIWIGIALNPLKSGDNYVSNHYATNRNVTSH